MGQGIKSDLLEIPRQLVVQQGIARAHEAKEEKH